MAYSAKKDWVAADGVGSADVNKWESGIEAANNELDPSTLTLTHGLQAVTTTQRTPARFTVQGRTLCNLLGTYGGCESLTGWTTSGTVATSTTQKKSGTYSVKFTGSASAAYAYRDFPYPLDSTKQYIVGLWVYLESYTSGSPALYVTDYGVGTVRYTAAASTGTVGSWQFVYAKIPTSNTIVGSGFRIYVGSTVSGTFVGYTEEIRLYEVSSTLYNAIGTTYTASTRPSIDDVLPYVDSVKHLSGVYVAKSGKNLLPPFTEWTLHANAVATEPYKLTHNATAAYQVAGTYIVSVISGQTYTVSVSDKTSGGRIVVYKDLTGSSTAAFGSNNSYTFTADATYNGYVRVIFDNGAATSGTFTFTNPQLEIGSTATTHEPRNDDTLYLPVTLASSIDGSVYDSVTERDGAWWRTKRFEHVDLTGALTWAFGSDYTGFKRVRLSNWSSIFAQFGFATDAASIGKIFGVKYDGRILRNYGDVGSWASGDIYSAGSTANLLDLSISDTDSGWGESYTPSAAEIQAYFYGYRMYDSNTYTATDTNRKYDGTGTKNWSKVDNSGGATGGALPTSAWAGYTPYKLSYQLATTVEEIVSAEGAVELHYGSNQVEVGTGAIVREVCPAPYLTGGRYYLNTQSGGFPTSAYFQYRTLRIAAIYKNGRADKKWTIDSSAPYGNQRAHIAQADYDTTAEYTVTYLALDKYLLTANPTSITAEIVTGAGSVGARNTQDIADARSTLGAFRSLLDRIFSVITGITGKTKWSDAPTATMEQINTVANAALPKAGGTMTGAVSMGDNNPIYFQDGNFLIKSASNNVEVHGWSDLKYKKTSTGTTYDVWTTEDLRTTSGYAEISIGGTWYAVGGVTIGASSTVQHSQLTEYTSASTSVTLAAKFIPKGTGDLTLTFDAMIVDNASDYASIMVFSPSAAAGTLYFDAISGPDWTTPLGTSMANTGWLEVKQVTAMAYTTYSVTVRIHSKDPFYIGVKNGATSGTTSKLKNIYAKYDVQG